MQLQNLPDHDLLKSTMDIVQQERSLLTGVLKHLREIDRRKLYCDLGYPSLFEYAVNELKYSEGQAGRRIQAMRLIKEIPEIEEKIASGALNLTNVSLAQSFFREVSKSDEAPMAIARKLEILTRLENKSSRAGQNELIKMSAQAALPKERERVVTSDQSEVRFLMSSNLKKKLEEVRSLAGPKAATMGYAELFEFMADTSAELLKSKKFGKKRASAASFPTPAPELKESSNPRYLSREVKKFVYTRDKNRCSNCGSKRNLNIDHIQPIARGGNNDVKNLRLLCFHCNQRARIAKLGFHAIDEPRPVQ